MLLCAFCHPNPQNALGQGSEAISARQRCICSTAVAMVQMLQVISMKFHHDAGTLNSGNVFALAREHFSMCVSVCEHELIFI